MDSTMPVHTMLLVLIISFCAELDAASPVFVSPLPTGGLGSIAENVAVGSVILVLNANDADGDKPNFSIVSQTPSTPTFSINQLDQLQVPSGLDYETTKVFNFIFRVTDGSSSAETQYTLTITNVDDEPPVFAKTSYGMSISELAPTGTTVLQVHATDPDSSNITFSISGAQTLFAIDPVDGVITVNSFSQLATYSGSNVTLSIKASDAATNTATTIATITITASPCRNNQCRNGGTCNVETENSFKCHCLSGYKGITCESVDHCFNKPCQNNGNCTSLQSTYSCECQFCFTGQNCSSPFNPCVHGNCKNNRCECDDGYTGNKCEHVLWPWILVAILCICGCGCYGFYKFGILPLKCLCICCEICKSLKKLPASELKDQCCDNKDNLNRCSLLQLDAKYVFYNCFNNNHPPDDLRNRICDSEINKFEDGKEYGTEGLPLEGAGAPFLPSKGPDVQLRRPCFWCNHCSYCKRDKNRWVYSVMKVPRS